MFFLTVIQVRNIAEFLLEMVKQRLLYVDTVASYARSTQKDIVQRYVNNL